jgi:hypothetical protein
MLVPGYYPPSDNTQKIRNLSKIATKAMSDAVTSSNTPQELQTGKLAGALTAEAIPILASYGMTEAQVLRLREDAAKALAMAKDAQGAAAPHLRGDELFISIAVATFRLLVSQQDGR